MSPSSTDVVLGLINYERLPVAAAIVVATQLCDGCYQQLKRRFQFPTEITAVSDGCPHCPQVSQHYQVNAVMDPSVFEKFISYDSFFGNYMVKKYTEILRQDRANKDKKNIPLPDIEDENWDEYFEQMLFQVMDHTNDLRVQKYFKELRDLPLDKIANNDTVVSPYPNEDKPSVYENFQRGDTVNKPGQTTAAAIPKNPLWEP